MNEENKTKNLWILMREPRLDPEQMASVYKAVATSRTLLEAQLEYRQLRHEQNRGTTEPEFKMLKRIWEKVVSGTADV